MNITTFFRRLFKPTPKEQILNIYHMPVDRFIECSIETPEFKNNKIYKYKIQTGVYDCKTMLFEPDSIFGYKIQFHDHADFAKALIKMSNGVPKRYVVGIWPEFLK